MADKIIYLTDRTTIETDWDCPRKRYWYKEFNGTGIVPSLEASYFSTGRIIHQAFADIAAGGDWEAVCEELSELYEGCKTQVEFETTTWLITMSAAFGKFIWPLWAAEYEVVNLESELVLDRSPLWVACTPDLVLRSRRTGRLVVKDYKSVGLLGKSWVDHWPYAVQMHILLKAISEEFKETASHANVVGLMKGSERDGKQRHPYLWGYMGAQGWSSAWKSGWELAPIWEHPSGPVGWVEELGEGVAFQQFPCSAPIYLDDRVLDHLLAQVLHRQKELDTFREMWQTDESLIDQFFPQHFSKCRPSFGDKCGYLGACHNAEINLDPLGSGLYKPRTPHHEVEILTGEETE